MSKEYLNGNDFPKQNVPKKPSDNKNIIIFILLAIISVLLAVITAVCVIIYFVKNQSDDPHKDADTSVSETVTTESGENASGIIINNGLDVTFSKEKTDPTSEASGSTNPAQTNSDSADSGSSGGSSSGSSSADKQPETLNEIVSYYNSAVNKAINSKAGYTKHRTTTLSTLEGGALLKIQIVFDMVNEFLGVGTTEYVNTKGSADFLSKASLTQNDIKSFNFYETNGIYTITLDLKPGKSTADASGSTDAAALQRSGLFVGKGDNKDFDYKNSGNFYTAVHGVGAHVESVESTVSKAMIIAKVDSATGRLISLEADWNWNAELTKVSYSIAKVESADAVGLSIVKISDFRW